MQKSHDGKAFPERDRTQTAITALDSPQGDRPAPIAIIGIGCHFPGARGPDAFWQLMRDGIDALSEIPADRFDINTYYDPTPGTPGKIVTRRGGFLKEVDQFDPHFFGISPREAASMDPQQRLLLEAAWEALEDAGQVPADLEKSPTGVFVGMCASDYGDLQLHFGEPANLDVYSVPGSARSILAGRLSYVLNLQGPGVAMDTACSSSLMALHLACQSLWSGECTLALAGGVNLMLMPEPFLGFSLARMLAPDGRCKAFDARADGFVRSEGAGVVVLKPLAAAQADGDPIYAVIRGSAANNDGHSSGLMMPSQQAQEEVLRAAYRHAGLSPGQVQYVEAHGTGTNVGDPIEARALGAVLAEYRTNDRPCIIGSVKTNIGHLEGGAGIAGLIKAALCLKHRMIPPSLNFEEPNPNVPWKEIPLVVQQELTPWPVDGEPAIAGVSSFGISGTNVHVVLEEAPPVPPRQEDEAASTMAHLLPLSAHTPEALQALAGAYRAHIVDNSDETPSLRDLCYSASLRRTHHGHRLALVPQSLEELDEHLAAFLEEELRPGMSTGIVSPGQEHKLVFVFSGQGPRWWPLDEEVLDQEPVLRTTLERCDALLRQYVDWSLLEQLRAPEERSRLDETDVVQPAIFASQVALAALWRSWGIEPDAVVGHSIGEVAAAHVAGALSLEDAIRIIYHRGRMTKKASGQGKMALVGLSLEEAQQALVGYEDRLSIAVNSSPTSSVLSGDPAALTEVLATLDGQNVFCRVLPAIDYAAHSPQMDRLTGELMESLAGIQPQTPSLPIYSTITAAPSQMTYGPDYWARNLREPVLFSKTVERLLADGYDIFLESHPHPVLPRSIQEVMAHVGRRGTVLPSLKRGEAGRATLLGSLGTLYTLGQPIGWKKLYASGGRYVPLPAYPWQRERFWMETDGQGNGRLWRRPTGAAGYHPLLGPHLKSAAHTGTHFWETDLSAHAVPFLADHRVQGLVVLPATAYLEMALAAAHEAFGPGAHVLEKVTFKKALFLPEKGTQTIQVVLSPDMPDMVSFQFFSRQQGAAEGQDVWTLHATGTIRIGAAEETAEVAEHTPLETLKARCPEIVSGADHYASMAGRGLDYGPSFQGVEQIWRQDGEAIGQMRFPETVTSSIPAYQVHPALLDACFQVLAAAVPKTLAQMDDGDTFLPVALEKLQFYRRLDADPDTNISVHTRLRTDEDLGTDTLVGDVFLLDETGAVIAEAQGLHTQRLGQGAQAQLAEEMDDWLYAVQWVPQERAQTASMPEEPGSWLIFADEGGVGKALAERLIAQDQRCVLVSSGETYRRTYKRADREYVRIDPANPADMQKLLETSFGPDQTACRGIIHLWGLDDRPASELTVPALETIQREDCMSALHLVQTLAQIGWPQSPRLWLATRETQEVGAADKSVSVTHAPLWGLTSVIANEHAELRCVAIDLGPANRARDTHALFQELWTDDGEHQIALRGDERYAARLVRYTPDRADQKRRPAEADEPYRLEISTPGILDNLTLRATSRHEPEPGQVEIQVYAAGLNFLDVLSALGIRPDQTDGPLALGMECAGKVVAVGDGVEGIAVGDEVIASAPYSFSAYTRSIAPFVVPKPINLSFEEAATIPVAFLTAHYALDYLGRLRQGERVLIHAAAGGVGLAAVRLAQRVGAEIFATAGNPDKRNFLRSLGVEHVMDSRSLAFADEVMEQTNGEGVDVVLNSLAGEAIPKSLSTLRANGRFLEIGKRDIYQNSQLGMAHFRKNIAFFAIDLIPMFAEQPEFCGDMLRELVHYFEDGSLKPLDHTVFPITEVDGAFRYMAQAKHIGKIVVVLKGESMQGKDVMIAPPLRQSITFPADASYLITGGLGALGLTVAQWMVERGARHLVLMGRSGPSSAAAETVATLEAAGAQIRIAQADVTRAEQMVNVLADIDANLPPLRGVIHAAGILDDGVLMQMNEERFRTVMAPKVTGSWVLHRLTQKRELDHFVLFSSAASVLGSPGQGNYVAANTFLDTLAHHRRTQGLPGLTINWGAWAEIGLAARPDRVAHVTQQGISAFTPAQGIQLLERILLYDPVQVTAIAIDWTKLLSFYSPPLFAQLAAEVAQQGGPSAAKEKKDGLSLEKILAVEPEKRHEVVENFLREQIAKVLRSSAAKLDVNQPLDQLGIDSLMAYELKNRVETDLEMNVPVAALLQGPSIAQLTSVLLEQLGTPTSAPAPADAEQEGEDDLLAHVEELSDQEVESLLHELSEEELAEEELSESRDHAQTSREEPAEEIGV